MSAIAAPRPWVPPAAVAKFALPEEDLGLVPSLQLLVDRRVLNGFALVTVQGVVGDVVGAALQQELKPAADGQDTACSLPPGALQFLRPFNTEQSAEDCVFRIADTKLHVIQQEPAALLALSRRRILGAYVLQLRPGLVLVTTWGPNSWPQQVVPLAQKLATRFNRQQL